MMQTLMEKDDGARQVEIIGLGRDHPSPVHTLSALGSASFTEPLHRNLAETHLVDDKRVERQRHGHIPWSTEKHVPDVGGLGWRTKTGHILKNQSFYIQRPKVNLWDHPCYAGTNTWKEWHGPRMRSDADMVERLDRFDEEQDEWEAKKTFVNTNRTETLDRFYNRKLNRTQLQSSSSWAPHRRSRREVSSKFDTFDGTLDEKPEKELKKVLTKKVLSNDRDAIRQITSRIQNEETWKEVFKQMESERRADSRADLQQRQAHTDRLMQLSGQPVRQHLPTGQVHASLTNCSERTEGLARPRPKFHLRDVTSQTDFRGLVHADNEHALEALFPGVGHELSVEFRSRATASTQAGWPAPPAAVTPRVVGKKVKSREAKMRESSSLSKLSIPSTTQRMQKLGRRTSDDLLMKHSKAQFLPTVPPPPLPQNSSLLGEDWSPSATMRDKARVTGDFARTDHSNSTHRAVEHDPPPMRSYTYPMMAPTSPESRKHDTNGLNQTGMTASASAPLLFGRSFDAEATGTMRSSMRKSKGVSELSTTTAVCKELEDFEAKAEAASVPRISNFFNTPRSQGAANRTNGRA